MGSSNSKKHQIGKEYQMGKSSREDVLKQMHELRKNYESNTSIQFPSPPYSSVSSHTRNVNYNVQSNVNLPPIKDYNYSGVHSGRTQDLSHSSQSSFAINPGSPVNTINTKSVTVIDKEKYSNKNQLVNHTTDQQISLPKILTQDDFMIQWFSWKKAFLKYMKSVDPTENYKEKWCIMLLNRMGPIGQEIYRTFPSEDSHEKGDINKILKNFDFYCIFGNLTRKDANETDKYVNALTVMASKHMTSTDEIVKEKILMQIDEDKFRRKIGNLIPGFRYPSGVQWLTVKEIAYIWMSYENFDFKREEKILQFQVKNCRNCGDTHALNRCRAHGKKCNKCGLENHLSYKCPSQRYFDNCIRCGESHYSRYCPAYENKCHKCEKLNHFSWKCGFQKLLQCKFCDKMHFASKPCSI